jgi:hypothetical protein
VLGDTDSFENTNSDETLLSAPDLILRALMLFKDVHETDCNTTNFGGTCGSLLFIIIADSIENQKNVEIRL